MIVQKVFIQNTASVVPSVFATSTEITSMLRVYAGVKYSIIPVTSFTPVVTIEKKQGKLVVTSTSAGNSNKVFSRKITASRVKSLPAEYLFHFNIDGKLLGVTKPHMEISLNLTRQLTPAKLSPATLISTNNRIDFISAMLKQILDGERNLKSGEILRIGFYIGDRKLCHTNQMAMPGLLAAAFSLEGAVRIKGIYKHAPPYAETVFWFELKQDAPTIYDIIKEEEFSLSFMGNLNKCL